MTREELLTKIAASERALARCRDSFLQKTLRETIAHYRRLLTLCPGVEG